MKNNITDVSLSFCCKEDWDSFETLDERSKFCAKCHHRVVDFSKATASDFAIEKSSGSLCGRFRLSQLSAAFILSLAGGTASSCTDPDILSTPVQVVPSEQLPNEEEVGQMLTGIVFFPDSIVDDNDSIPRSEGDGLPGVVE